MDKLNVFSFFSLKKDRCFSTRIDGILPIEKSFSWFFGLALLFLPYSNTIQAQTCAPGPISSISNSPSFTSGGGVYCHGNIITLTQSGGTNGLGAVNVWYAASGQATQDPASCPEAFVELWNQFNYMDNVTGCYYIHSNSLAGSSLANGILSLEAGNDPEGDPYVWMYPLPNNATVNADVYKYVNVRYKITHVPHSLTPKMGILFTKRTGACGTAVTDYIATPPNPSVSPFEIPGIAGHMNKDIVDDGNWHVISFPVHSLPNWNGTVTGLRFDYFDNQPHTINNGAKMDVDFITISKHPMIGEGASITLTPGDEYYPTETTTYYAKKIDNCGVTDCKTETVILPTKGSVLANDNESATCTVNAGERVDFYHESGRLIAVVEGNAGSLGVTTATAYVESSVPLVEACYNNNPAYATSVMQRHWVITPAIKNLGALVFLPFENSEYVALANASVLNSNPNDNVNTSSLVSVMMSKYSGLNENRDFDDNCGNGNTILHAPATFGDLNGYLPVFANNQKYTGYFISSFSEFWLHGASSSPLPVTLTDFSVSCDKQAALSWTTASEQSSDYFILEKSRNLSDWTFVTKQNAAGTSNLSINYHVTDQYSWNGVVYYRLRQIDLNGEQAIYEPISVYCEGNENAMKVYPNPNSGSFTVEILSEELITDGQLYLTDMTGKVIISRKINIVDGTTQIMIDDLNLQMGTYLVSIRFSEKKSTTRELNPIKVVITK